MHVFVGVVDLRVRPRYLLNFSAFDFIWAARQRRLTDKQDSTVRLYLEQSDRDIQAVLSITDSSLCNIEKLRRFTEIQDDKLI
jgi:hypothetical protein